MSKDQRIYGLPAREQKAARDDPNGEDNAERELPDRKWIPNGTTRTGIETLTGQPEQEQNLEWEILNGRVIQTGKPQRD